MRQAVLHSTHAQEKSGAKGRYTVGRGKRRRALKLVCQTKASTMGTQHTPATVGRTVAQGTARSAPAGPEHHPGLSFGPALPFPLGLRRKDPCISLPGLAGVCVMGRGRKALDHMKRQGHG